MRGRGEVLEAITEDNEETKKNKPFYWNMCRYRPMLSIDSLS